MKNIIKSATFLLVMTAALTACNDRTEQLITYEANVPVYMAYNDFRASFEKSAPIEISHPGKMYFKDGYLFVNEYGKGIHIIDNSNPASPQKVAFYEIMGNVDMAIKGNVLFADSYIDLLAIDITDLNNPIEIDRIENVFPEIVTEGEEWFPYAMVDKSKGVIVDWEVKKITEKMEDYSQGGWIFRGEMDFMANTASGAKWTGGSGTGGSMARFMLNDNYLYVIAVPTRLKTVDITTVTEIAVIDSVIMPRNMETLFRLEDNLFVGTTTGMLIFDLVDPQKPAYVSAYDHITACDPVVVDGQYAYVTLRSGNTCNNAQNLLEVIDISSLANPYLVKSYPMFNPHGLGTDGDLLFVCDGTAGLKIYDKSDPLAIITNKIAHYPDFDTYDVIPMNGILMLVGEGGIYQYDYTDPENIVQISHITIKEE
ncbi:MAG: LVIVD repeat-containing protein [Bacteroidales bacterium]